MKTKTKNNIITTITIVGGFTLYFAILTLVEEKEVESKTGIAFMIALLGLFFSVVAICLQNARVTTINEKLEHAKSLKGAKGTMTDHILENAKEYPVFTHYTPPEVFSTLMRQYVEEDASAGALKNLIKTTKFDKDNFLDAIRAAIKHLRIDHLRILLDGGEIDINTISSVDDERTLLHYAASIFPSMTLVLSYTNLIEFLVIERGISRSKVTNTTTGVTKQTAADIFKGLTNTKGVFVNEDTDKIRKLLDPNVPLADLTPNPLEPLSNEQAAQEIGQASQESTDKKTPGGKDNKPHTK